MERLPRSRDMRAAWKPARSPVRAKFNGAGHRSILKAAESKPRKRYSLDVDAELAGAHCIFLQADWLEFMLASVEDDGALREFGGGFVQGGRRLALAVLGPVCVLRASLWRSGALVPLHELLRVEHGAPAFGAVLNFSHLLEVERTAIRDLDLRVLLFLQHLLEELGPGLLLGLWEVERLRLVLV